MSRYKNISASCPLCSVFSPMPILKTVKEEGKPALYVVRCESCDCIFESEKKNNFWAEISRNFNLSGDEIKYLKREVLGHILKHGEMPPIENTGAMLIVNNFVIFRREN